MRVIPAAAARILGPKELKVSLKPGAKAELNTSIVATGKAKSFRIEATASGDDLFSSCLYFSTVPTMKIPRLPDSAHWSKSIGILPEIPVDGNGSPFKASLRLAICGNQLLLQVDTVDATPLRGPNLWDGSSIELFIAPGPGAPRIQWIAAPAFGKTKPLSKLATPSGLLDAEGVELQCRTTKKGWSLAAAIPLKILNIAPDAISMALDLAVNAVASIGEGMSRAFLAGESNPHPDSNNYVRVTVEVPEE
ncbi:MAG: hypothetical protein HQL31_09495 [Planctomycetes bacterium]|nr:hypothetical protein [Planctomycetota bacterium]